MTSRDCSIKYVPCFFEYPFEKILARRGLDARWWPCVVIWMFVGIMCLMFFSITLNILKAEINWFTALYFIGGLGWLPASMCALSHAYHKMCEEIFPFFNEQDKDSEDSLQKFYNNSANLIFGYIRESNNRWIAFVVWVCMIITVIWHGPTFGADAPNANRFIYVCYIFVGFVFTSVLCAVIYFIRALTQMRKYTPKDYSLYNGIADMLHENRSRCATLIWLIVVLLAMLSIAMLRSPFERILWLWLPLFGGFPFVLFVENNLLAKSLINKALLQEEKTIQFQIDKTLQSDLHQQKYVFIHSLIGVRDMLRGYARNKNAVANTILLFFTILGAIGSVAAAVLAAMPDEIIANTFSFLSSFV